MVFSSLVFLYVFLPLTLIIYYLINRNLRNYILLFASLVFVAWGGVSLISVIIISIFFNYTWGLLIHWKPGKKKTYFYLFTGILVNLGLLIVFKYANFLIGNINCLMPLINLKDIPGLKIIAPIGISFYTFHAISYLIDIYRKRVPAQKNILHFSSYILLFFKVIAGPIVRYPDIASQLNDRTHSIANFSDGIERFLIGIAKKIMIANTFARAADGIFSSNINDLSAPNAWLGIISFFFQIYFDFAGYSDMAIGLGKMLGFEIKENFNLPYLSKSITEFWTRWHISLSTWFRDYLFLPLSYRLSKKMPKAKYWGIKTEYWMYIISAMVTFLLCGIWHNASWNFIIWGGLHGLFLIIERIGVGKLLKKVWFPIANLYTLILIIFSWVFFRTENFTAAFKYFKALFNFHIISRQTALFYYYMNKEYLFTSIIAVLGAWGFFTYFGKRVDKILRSEKMTGTIIAPGFHIVSAVFYVFLLYICTMYMISATYNPFIYYKF